MLHLLIPRLIHCALALLALFQVSCSVLDDGLSREQRKIVSASRWQINKTTSYSPTYQRLNYPNGDLPMRTGVCTDVVIRALRKGLKIDLQKEIHEDMVAHFDDYPQLWGLRAADPNIDHRRVPNQRVYFG